MFPLTQLQNKKKTFYFKLGHFIHGSSECIFHPNYELNPFQSKEKKIHSSRKFYYLLLTPIFFFLYLSVSGQEGQWGEWSEWSECNATLHVSTRTRPCLTKSGVRLTSVDRCLLIPGTKSDLDIRKCSPDPVVENDASHEDSDLSHPSKEEAPNRSKEEEFNNSKEEKFNNAQEELVEKLTETPSVEVALVQEIDETKIRPEIQESEENVDHMEAKVRKERTN